MSTYVCVCIYLYVHIDIYVYICMYHWLLFWRTCNILISKGNTKNNTGKTGFYIMQEGNTVEGDHVGAGQQWWHHENDTVWCHENDAV